MSDDSDLRWFFGGCRVSFDSSPTGLMLERLENLSQTEEGERIPSRAKVRAASWAHRQRQCEQPLGVLSMEEFEAMRAGVEAAGLDEDPALTADTGRELHEYATSVSEVALFRYSTVRRSLLQMDAAYVEALSLYYGPDGARWVRHQLGRLVVLYPLTEPARALLEARKRRLHQDGEHTALARLVAEYEENKQWPDVTRARLLRQCEEESRILLARAKVQFASVASG